MITPKQKKVTVLSVSGPASPVPFSARAAGAARSEIASAASRAEATFVRRRLHSAKSIGPGRIFNVAPLGCLADGLVGSHSLRRRRGDHRVPADLEHRPPDRPRGAPQPPDRRSRNHRLHGDHPVRGDRRDPGLPPRGRRQAPRGLGPRAPRPEGAQRLRLPLCLGGDRRVDPDRDRRHRLQGPDRDHPAKPLVRRLGPDPVERGDVLRRQPGHPAPARVRCHLARHPDHRHRPVRGADSRASPDPGRRCRPASCAKSIASQ